MTRVLVGLALLLCACAGPGNPDAPVFLSDESAGETNLPFSEAVRASGLLFVSGQIGAAPGSLSVVPGGIQAEARQALDNIAAILTRHGSSMDRVVKCTVFLADVSEWADFNEVYVRYFAPGALPARSALGAGGLAAGARVEVECIAAAGP